MQQTGVCARGYLQRVRCEHVSHPGMPAHFNEHPTQKYVTVREVLVHNLEKRQRESKCNNSNNNDNGGDW